MKLHMRSPFSRNGFTLIELSIVLVIIGLIVGGVLVGQNLIHAANVRATITQIEKYKTAANTFRDKYSELPGDLQPSLATQFGFQYPSTRAGTQGRGDGNGIIEGYNYTGSTVQDAAQSGETLFFWEDLSSAHLIDGSFTTAGDYQNPTNSTPWDPLMPAAKIGNGNYFYVYSRNSNNFFGLSVPYTLQSQGLFYTNVGLTVNDAYGIDTKIDDGIPQSGTVIALIIDLSNYYWWAGGGGVEGAHSGVGTTVSPTTVSTPGSATTCYDNGSTAGQPQQYSVEQNGGTNVNCGLSFQF